ncbi:MAG: hypothetical protein ACI9BO_001901 [Zhongshania sp.]
MSSDIYLIMTRSDIIQFLSISVESSSGGLTTLVKTSAITIQNRQVSIANDLHPKKISESMAWGPSLREVSGDDSELTFAQVELFAVKI